MAGIVRMTVRLDGLRRILRNTDERTLLAPAMHEALQGIGEMGVTTAKRAAPKGPSSNGHVGGLTAANFGMRMQARPLPLWVKVETTATRKWQGHRNYSYPKRVEWDPKLHHAGWLRAAFGQLKSRFDSTLAAAGRTIETGWGS